MKCLACNKNARYGQYCAAHATARCSCGVVAGRRNCANCTRGKIRKKFEMQIRDLLQSEGIDEYIHNKKVGKYSPDFLWHRPSHVVILEVDEHGHATYDPAMEEKRMEDISQKFQNPVFFLRISVPCEKETESGMIAELRQLLSKAEPTPSALAFFSGMRVNY